MGKQEEKMEQAFDKRFVQQLLDLKDRWEKRQDKTETIDGFLTKQKVSDFEEEENLNRELCEYVDAFYAKRNAYESVPYNTNKFMEKEVNNAVNDMLPDATDGEKEEIEAKLIDMMNGRTNVIVDVLVEDENIVEDFKLGKEVDNV